MCLCQMRAVLSCADQESGQIARIPPPGKSQVAKGFLKNSRTGPIASRGMSVGHSVKYADY